MLDLKEYLDTFNRGTKDLNLNVMHYFIEQKDDNIIKNMKFIHVTGTNGKGSYVEILSNILKIQGYRVGTFMSPHLIRYNERIKINNNEISDEKFIEIIEELKPQIKVYNEQHDNKITFFELITIIAFIYFFREKVDFVILEVGLRGTI